MRVLSAKIFVNYRRDDSASHAMNIAQYLENAFGRENVFIDVDRFKAGQHFPEVLADKVRSCNAMLVVIGPNWLNMRDPATGSRRLDQPGDWVRLEIQAALARGICVIPILVGGAKFPLKRDLPPELHSLYDRHHVVVTTSGFRYEMAGLAKDIAEVIGSPNSSPWNRRIMPIAFRLSIVAALVGAIVSVGEYYLNRHRLAADSGEGGQ